jgi:hypothetical protein
MSDMNPQQIQAILAGKMFPLSDEKRLQNAIEDELQRAGVIVKREYRLSTKDIIDFMVGSVGIEVKIKGGKLDIYRQLERYAEHELVSHLILVTNVAMGLPPDIKGKPTSIINLARAWL